MNEFQHLSYFKFCESLTSARIYNRIHQHLPNDERLLDEFIECFVADLFCCGVAATSLTSYGFYATSQFGIYTQKDLTSRLHAGTPLLGLLTPDLLFIFNPSSPSPTRIAFDAANSKDFYRVFDEKKQKYQPAVDHVVQIVYDKSTSTYACHLFSALLIFCSCREASISHGASSCGFPTNAAERLSLNNFRCSMNC